MAETIWRRFSELVVVFYKYKRPTEFLILDYAYNQVWMQDLDTRTDGLPYR